MSSRAIDVTARRAAGTARPARVVVALLVFQVLCWGIVCGALDPAPPTDSLEQVLFSQELRPFYVKHPALPTWILYGVNRVFGPSVFSTFVLGALCSAVTLGVLFVWARPLVGAQRAALAALLASTIVYMNVGAIQYSNNTAQLPFAMLSIVFFHRAVVHGGRRDWALLGVAAGLMALVKLSAIVLFASFGLYLLWAGRLRRAETWRGIALATVPLMMLVGPTLLAAHRANPAADQYMHDMLFPPESGRFERLMSVWDFGWAQVGAVAPACLLFLWLRRRAPASGPDRRTGDASLAAFLSIVGFGPFVLTVVVAALFGVRLLSGWGTTFFLLLPLWLLVVPARSVAAGLGVLPRAAVAAAVVQLALLGAMVVNGGALPNLNFKGRRCDPLAPAELAQAARKLWTSRTGAELRYVVSDIRTGAALAAAHGGAPLVIDGNRPDFEHFFPPQRRATCGFVVVASRPPVRDPAAANFDPLDKVLNQSGSLEQIQLRQPEGSNRTFFIGVRLPEDERQCGDDLLRVPAAP